MTSPLRWRIMTLQAMLVLVLAFCAGFSFWASGYVHSTIRDQLSSQQITFPKANDPGISAQALRPCGNLAKNVTCTIPTSAAIGLANSKAMQKYAGQAMTTGAQAQTYANNYVAVHLSDMGMTYSEASAQALKHPTNTQMANLANTLFKGTTLRGMLLQAYGWWTVGDYTGLAGIGLLLAALAVLGAFLFELYFAVRTTTVTVAPKVGQPISAVTA